ncbi:UNKNOWN [Stylonychia lemnae]|uniref:Transmembrane protein n=1 Tax=Stylonychia lemnae TaxID=5949 RepID=A0A078A753_STYLE|nr:UNKNOWN [Stylonychia lemnae]|eukprot:CDW78075.1 UNKNOWN [Stylonychia lemnae]
MRELYFVKLYLSILLFTITSSLIKAQPVSVNNTFSTDTCFRCLVKNEFIIQQKLDLTLVPYTYFSYCVYENKESCCLMAADGFSLQPDNLICQFGRCSNNNQKLDMKKLQSQYIFCQSDIQPDEFCGPQKLKLSNYSKPSPAMQLYYDPNNVRPNSTNETNNDTNNNNQTNGTTNNQNGTNSTNGTNNNNTTNNTQNNNITENSTSTNTTINNDTAQSNQTQNNQSNSTSDNNNDTSHNDSNQTQTNNTNQTNIQSNQTTNTSDSKPDNSTNENQNQTDNDNPVQIQQNETQNNQSQEQSQINQKRILQQLIKQANLPKQNINSNNEQITESNQRNLKFMDDIRICIYDLEIDDNLFQQYDKQQDGVKLEIVQNNINNLIFMLDYDQNRSTKLTDQNLISRIEQNETMKILSIFDDSKYVTLYIEYMIEDQDYIIIDKNNTKNDDDDNQEKEQSYKKPLLISAYAVAGIIFIAFCVLTIRYLVKCQKRKHDQIKLMGEVRLSDEKDKTSVPNDLEKAHSGIIDDSHQANVPKKLSELLFYSGQKPQSQTCRVEQRRSSAISNQGYNLTMDDLNKRSHQSNAQTEVDKNIRSKEPLNLPENLSKQESLPQFGEQPIIHNKTEGSDGQETNSNFGNLVRKINAKMAKTINHNNDSEQGSFRDMPIKKGPKSFKRRYDSSSGENSVDGERVLSDLNNDIRKQFKHEQAQGSQGDFEEKYHNNRFKSHRPDTAKLRNDQLFNRRKSSGHSSVMRQRPSGDLLLSSQQSFTIDVDRVERTIDDASKFGGLVEKISRQQTDGANKPAPRSNTFRKIENDAIERKRQTLNNNNNNLQIFQSESKFDEYEYMQQDADSINKVQLPQADQAEDEDEIKSGFHSVLKEQFKQTKIDRQKKGILKKGYSQEQQARKIQQTQNQNLDARERRRLKLLEQQERQKDEDYYQNNNIIFHTGTFNGDDEDDISNISAF